MCCTCVHLPCQRVSSSIILNQQYVHDSFCVKSIWAQNPTIMHMKPGVHPFFPHAEACVDGNPLNQQKFTCVLPLGNGKSPYGKCMKSQTAITAWWGRLRENWQSTSGITAPHHETPPGAHDGYFVLQCKSAGVDITLGQCVGMFSNTITCTVVILVQYYRVGARLLLHYIQHLYLAALSQSPIPLQLSLTYIKESKKKLNHSSLYLHKVGT